MSILTTHPLIRSIGAVRGPITTPLGRYAHSIITLECIFLAFGRLAIQFITVILTVLVAVATPSLLYAFAIVTGKLIGTTGFIWR